MIQLEEALSIISGFAKTKNTREKVELADSLHRVLAADVLADTNFPSFDKSAMDGYAILKNDINKVLQIVEFIPAGKKPEKKILPGTCANIMTGAMMPEGAEMVVMNEDVVVNGNEISITNPDSKENILSQGEDVKKGSLLLKKGTVISPAIIGLLASTGVSEPLVFKKPLISILATGDELVSPNEVPEPPKIRNSNSAQLCALATDSGATTIHSSQVGDNKQLIFEAVKNSLRNSDIVVITGGASVGDLDFTAEVFEKLEAEIHFTQIAIQPGKPALFATIGDKFLFGLSGNPVSSFVQFQLLVKPVIQALTGRSFEAKEIKIPITSDQKRKRAERQLFFPVKFTEKMEAEPIDYHGSAHLNAYQSADGMAYFPVGIHEIKKGTLVNVRPL
ncbi:MAG TPA: gephyrin-like molybdotransferase Glp [Bacteroidales bacterium]